MQHYTSLEETSLQNAWLTIGVFDGVHRGHRAIIEKLVREAHEADAPAVVLTFHPHPASVLTGKEIHCLTTPDERADLLAKLGVDVVITQRFTRDLSTATAHEYMSTLKRTLGLSRLLIGYDFALGKGREGNAARLTEIGSELGYSVEVVPAVSDESGVISSTEIRKLVSTGNVARRRTCSVIAIRLAGRSSTARGAGRRSTSRRRTSITPTKK
jgi:riboflavin kinase / FMN adenylyltransferase